MAFSLTVDRASGRSWRAYGMCACRSCFISGTHFSDWKGYRLPSSLCTFRNFLEKSCSLGFLTLQFVDPLGVRWSVPSLPPRLPPLQSLRTISTRALPIRPRKRCVFITAREPSLSTSLESTARMLLSSLSNTRSCMWKGKVLFVTEEVVLSGILWNTSVCNAHTWWNDASIAAFALLPSRGIKLICNAAQNEIAARPHRICYRTYSLSNICCILYGCCLLVI